MSRSPIMWYLFPSDVLQCTERFVYIAFIPYRFSKNSTVWSVNSEEVSFVLKVLHHALSLHTIWGNRPSSIFVDFWVSRFLRQYCSTFELLSSFLSFLVDRFSDHPVLPILFSFVPTDIYAPWRAWISPDCVLLKPSLVEMRSMESDVPNSFAWYKKTGLK